MSLPGLSSVIAITLIGTQIFGPAVLWAAEMVEHRGLTESTHRLIVTGLSGGDIRTQPSSREVPNRSLRFRDNVAYGELLSIGQGTFAEILIGHQALVTAQGPTQFRITQQTDGQPIISLEKGELLVAVASSVTGHAGRVMLDTPHARLVTDGGLVRISTEAELKPASFGPQARPPHVLLTSHTLAGGFVLAAEDLPTEFFQVLDGSGKIVSMDASEPNVALESGQGVHIVGGSLGTPSVQATSTQTGQRVTAVADHAQTPELGAQHLAEQQMQQAVALQQVLLGASESTSDEMQGQNVSKNAVISTLNANLSSGSSGSTDSLLASLFGSGNPYNQGSQSPQDRGGTGYGGNNNQGFNTTQSATNVPISGGNGLLIFTEKNPFAAASVDPSSSCLPSSCSVTDLLNPSKVILKAQPSISSNFTAVKELLLIGGAPNQGHGGIAPKESLIVRGAAPFPGSTFFSNVAATPTVFPQDGLFIQADFGPRSNNANSIETIFPLQNSLTAQNSTFVVQTPSVQNSISNPIVGGTLAQYSSRQDSIVFAPGFSASQGSVDTSYVDAAITATGPVETLKGGVTLDHGTVVTIGTTAATNNYFTSTPALDPADVKSSGSLISIIAAPSGPVSLTINDRALAVFDGSSVIGGSGNKALLSVLDSRLIGPGSVPLIDVDAARGAPPSIQNVSSAVVVRSTVPVVSVDQALLVATAPLLALTTATMTTTSHFADLAGNKNQALNLQASALVGLNAASLAIQNGHLLSLNAANATITGYLFSLANGSALSINNGLLFSLTNGSSLNLNANAFGVFGSGTNTLTVANGLCGGGASCGHLVNSANSPLLLNGNVINVAGVNQNVVLPNNFNVFAVQGQTATPKVNIGASDALFRVDATSTLTINNTAVKK